MYVNINIFFFLVFFLFIGVFFFVFFIGGVCVFQQVFFYFVGVDEKVEWLLGVSVGVGVVGVKNYFKINENDWFVEVIYEVFINMRVIFGLVVVVVIVLLFILLCLVERGYSERKEIKWMILNFYFVIYYVVYVIVIVEFLYQQIISLSIYDLQYDKFVLVDGQGEIKEQKGKLQMDGMVVNGLSLGMLKFKRVSMGGKKRGDRGILLLKR